MQDAVVGDFLGGYFPTECCSDMKRIKGQEKRQEQDSGTLAHIENDLTWIKRVGWGLAGIYAFIFVGFITWYLPKELGEVRDSVKQDTVIQIEDHLRPIQQQLAEIQGQLQLLRASQSPSKTLKEISTLDKQTFSASLPALRKIIEEPVAKIKPDQETLKLIVLRLRQTSETSPDYWPTVLQFIQFASSGLSPDVPSPGKPTYQIARNVGIVKMHHMFHEIILLDGGELRDSDFHNCRIIFTIHPVQMFNVTFINCIFEMPTVSAPNEYLQKAARILLASDFTEAFVPSL